MEIHRKTMETHGNPQEIHGKIHENPQLMGNPRENPPGNPWKDRQVTRLRVAMAAFESPEGCGLEGVAPGISEFHGSFGGKMA